LQNEDIKKDLISSKIYSLIKKLLDKFVLSIGEIVKHFSTNSMGIYKAVPEKSVWMSHSFICELLKNLICHYPPLITNLLIYRISIETIQEYFGAFQFLNYSIKSYLKNDDGHQFVEFMDFLFLINPYIFGTSHQLVILIFSNNYFFQRHQNDNENIVASSDIWYSQILLRCIKEFSLVLESQIFKDLNHFLKFHHLQMLIIAIINSKKSKIIPFSKDFLIEEYKMIITLYELCLISMKESKDLTFLPFFHINGVFFTLLKKLYKRIVKIRISEKKTTPYNKKDILYLR